MEYRKLHSRDACEICEIPNEPIAFYRKCADKRAFPTVSVYFFICRDEPVRGHVIWTITNIGFMAYIYSRFRRPSSENVSSTRECSSVNAVQGCAALKNPQSSRVFNAENRHWKFLKTTGKFYTVKTPCPRTDAAEFSIWSFRFSHDTNNGRKCYRSIYIHFFQISELNIYRF